MLYTSKYENDNSVFTGFAMNKISEVVSSLRAEGDISLRYAAIGEENALYPSAIWSNYHVAHASEERIGTSDMNSVLSHVVEIIEKCGALSQLLGSVEYGEYKGTSSDELNGTNKVALAFHCDVGMLFVYLRVNSLNIQVGTIVSGDVFFVDRTAIWAYVDREYNLVLERDKIPCMKVSSEKKYKGGYSSEYLRN